MLSDDCLLPYDAVVEGSLCRGDCLDAQPLVDEPVDTQQSLTASDSGQRLGPIVAVRQSRQRHTWYKPR